MLDVVVFDLETTGLSPQKDGIVEIGAMRIVGGQLSTDTFQSLVRPRSVKGEQLSIPWPAQRVHGITDAMVAQAPEIAEVLPAFLEWAGDSAVVAHNVGFDSGFVRAAALAQQLRWAPRQEFCTVKLSRRVFPAERAHNLDALAGRLGLSFAEGGRHRSLGDVEVTAQAYLQLRERLGGRL
ncbi:PolC-type DNA polymerase III [Deinococcus lacus]|uniref:PolC-type DNA polymerase III n=1 Tax=Deinococcus lacus TaxID=392561 RepID=A0ABW1YBP2_9DEIO